MPQLWLSPVVNRPPIGGAHFGRRGFFSRAGRGGDAHERPDQGDEEGHAPEGGTVDAHDGSVHGATVGIGPVSAHEQARAHFSAAVEQRGEVAPAGDVELGEHVGQVVVHRTDRDEEALGDLRVRQAEGRQLGDSRSRRSAPPGRPGRPARPGRVTATPPHASAHEASGVRPTRARADRPAASWATAAAAAASAARSRAPRVLEPRRPRRGPRRRQARAVAWSAAKGANRPSTVAGGRSNRSGTSATPPRRTSVVERDHLDRPSP